jgi:hypothetical protein
VAFDNLIPGGVYIVAAKDFSIAVWNGESFRGPRYTNGSWSLSDELPYEMGLPFGTASAKEHIGGDECVLKPPYDGHNVLMLLVALNSYYESRLGGLNVVG